MFKDLSKTDSRQLLDRLFLSVWVPPRGGIFGTHTLAERLFLSLSPSPRGGIFGKHDLSRRLDLVSKSGPAFFISFGPASRGDFRPFGGPRGHQIGRAGGFFCPFEKPLAQFAFSEKKNFRSKKFLSPKIPPRGGTRTRVGSSLSALL